MGRRLVTLAILLLPLALLAAEHTELDKLNKQVDELLDDWQWPEAEGIARKALSLAEAEYGKGSRELILPLVHLARCYLFLGRSGEDDELSKRAQAIADKHGEPGGLPTVTLMEHLAYRHWYQQEYGQAKELFGRVLQIRQQQAKPDPMSVATSERELAHLLVLLGKHSEAELLLASALATAERVAPTSKELGEILVGMAYLRIAQKEHDQAKACLGRAFKVYGDAPPSDHPMVADAQLTMARLHSLQRQPGEAEALRRKALAIEEKAWGASNPYTIRTLFVVGTSCREQGKLVEAEEAHRQALSLCREHHGGNSRLVQKAMLQLEVTLYAQRKYEAAEGLLREMLAASEKAEGPTHSSTITRLLYLANICRRQGKTEEANALLTEALQRTRKGLDSDDGKTDLPLLGSVTSALIGGGKYEEAEELASQALALAEKKHGADHVAMVQPLLTLAKAQRLRNRLPEAEASAKSALVIAEQTDPADPILIAKTLNGLGCVHSYAGEYNKAEPVFRRELSIRMASSSPPDLWLAAAQVNLTNALRKQGKLAEAESLALKALETIDSRPGEHEADTASALAVLGQIKMRQRQYPQARKHLERALAIREKVLPADATAIAENLHGLGQLHLSQGTPAAAETCFRRALTFRAFDHAAQSGLEKEAFPQ